MNSEHKYIIVGGTKDGQLIPHPPIESKSVFAGDIVYVPQSIESPAEWYRVCVDGKKLYFWNVTQVFSSDLAAYQAEEARLAIEGQHQYTEADYFGMGR